MKVKAPTESEEQIALADWLRLNNYLFYKSPSETYTTSWSQKRKNKAEWVTKGFPDITIVLKRRSLLFIELKKQGNILNNGKRWVSSWKVSEEQKKWIETLSRVDNIEACVCYGAEEAINLIKKIEIL